MTYRNTKDRDRGSRLMAIAVLALAAVIACWALTTLFPVELRQTAQWLEARFEALRN